MLAHPLFHPLTKHAEISKINEGNLPLMGGGGGAEVRCKYLKYFALAKLLIFGEI